MEVKEPKTAADRLSVRVQEAARLTGIPASTLRTAIHEGRLRAVRYGGNRQRGRYVIALEDLRAFLDRGKSHGNPGRSDR